VRPAPRRGMLRGGRGIVHNAAGSMSSGRAEGRETTMTESAHKPRQDVNARSPRSARRSHGARGTDAPRRASEAGQRVLVLNAGWEPLGAVGYQRAVV